MAEYFFKEARAFFIHLDEQSSPKKSSAQWLATRSELLRKMIDEMARQSEAKKFYCALAIFSALNYIGLGIATEKDLSHLRDGQVYPFTRKHPLACEVLRTLQQNWNSASEHNLWDGKACTNEKEFTRRGVDLWSGGKTQEDKNLIKRYYKAIEKGFCLEKKGWPGVDCDKQVAEGLVEAFVPETVKKKQILGQDACKILKERLTSDNNPMKLLNERVGAYFEGKVYPDIEKLMISADTPPGDDPKPGPSRQTQSRKELAAAEKRPQKPPRIVKWMGIEYLGKDRKRGTVYTWIEGNETVAFAYPQGKFRDYMHKKGDDTEIKELTLESVAGKAVKLLFKTRKKAYRIVFRHDDKLGIIKGSESKKLGDGLPYAIRDKKLDAF